MGAGAGKTVAVIGAGAIGSRYVEWAKRLGAEVGVYDSSTDRLAALRKGGGARVFDTLEDVRTWQPSHVIVSVPPGAHKAASLPFIADGARVLVEKPIAGSVEDGRAIEAAAANGSGQTFVVCNMRFHTAVQCLKDNLGKIGRPLYFLSRFGHRLSQMRSKGGEFARTRAAGGGVILDCIHELDYQSWLFGAAEGVNSDVTCFGLDTVDAEDLAQIHVTHGQGVKGTLLLDFLRREKIRGLEITGEDASLVWLSEGKKPEVCRVTLSDQHGSEVLLEDGDLDGEIDYLRMLESFFGDGTDLQSVGQAVKTLEVALLAQDGNRS